jgi:ArsR family metal-binding transcriptional regulator
MDVRLSRPCVEDPTRYIAECNLGRKVAMEKLCEFLRNREAKDLKCSVKLGVARFEMEGRSVMIYQSGRVDIRRITSTDEARDVMDRIMDMIEEALSDKSA